MGVRDEIVRPLRLVGTRSLRDPALHVQIRCKCKNRRSYRCTKSEAGIAALLRILDGCTARGGLVKPKLRN
jgi:hypothetical protein